MRATEEAALRRLRAAFAENFALGAESGASVCVWQDGREVLRLDDGWRDAARTVPWDDRTLVLVWSATKGPAAACVLHAMQAQGVRPGEPVAAVWPEFGVAGKDRVTLADLLSHRAGLAALERDGLDIFDLEGVADALAAQAPNWPPGTAHGYAPRTSGFWLDALVRRLAGISLGAYWRRVFGEPAGLDFWIGVPEDEHGRIAQMQAARLQDLKEPGPFEQALAEPESLTSRSFARPSGLAGASSTNRPAVWGSENPSFGGVGNAVALAEFYGRLGSGEWLQGVWRAALARRLSNGPDLVLRNSTAFSAGFMMDPIDAGGRKLRRSFGPSLSAFGHAGAGGSLAFADPDNALGFAYVMNRMEHGVLREARPLRLVRALYGMED